MDFPPDWRSTVDYEEGDEVRHGGARWKLLMKSARGHEPGTNLSVWASSSSDDGRGTSRWNPHTSDPPLSVFVKLLEQGDAPAAGALLNDHSFIEAISRHHMKVAHAKHQNTIREKKAKFEGNYAYSKATHHAVESALVSTIGSLHAFIEIERMGNAINESRIDELERRLASIEGNTLKYCGVWREGISYSKGDSVTFGGSMWYCKEGANTSRPNTPESGWIIAVKRGRDGKDAA